MYEITTEVSFSAAHRLRDYSGPCENVHGHNWLVKATVRCGNLDKAGIGIDFKVLRRNLHDVVGELDHKDLNEVFDPLGLNPSSENIARYLFEKLQGLLAGWEGTVVKTEVFETPGNSAAYFK